MILLVCWLFNRAIPPSPVGIDLVPRAVRGGKRDGAFVRADTRPHRGVDETFCFVTDMAIPA